LAAKFVATNPDVIVAGFGTETAKAAQAATTAIPIIFTSVGDPIRAGIVKSLSQLRCASSASASLPVAVDDLEPNRRYALAFKFLPRLCECCGNRMKTDALTAVRLRHNERALSAK
jgi:hypothetical protein